MNKMLKIALFLTLISCGNQDKMRDKVTNKIHCDTIAINTQLKQLAIDFKPNSIDINKSMSNDLNAFLTTNNADCIKSSDNYKPFVMLILLKVAYWHKKEYHLSYNLRSMKNGSAKNIIDGYESISQDHDEFLSSYAAFRFIKKDSTLTDRPEFKSVYGAALRLFKE